MYDYKFYMAQIVFYKIDCRQIIFHETVWAKRAQSSLRKTTPLRQEEPPQIKYKKKNALEPKRFVLIPWESILLFCFKINPAELTGIFLLQRASSFPVPYLWEFLLAAREDFSEWPLNNRNFGFGHRWPIDRKNDRPSVKQPAGNWILNFFNFPGIGYNGIRPSRSAAGPDRRLPGRRCAGRSSGPCSRSYGRGRSRSRVPGVAAGSPCTGSRLRPFSARSSRPSMDSAGGWDSFYWKIIGWKWTEYFRKLQNYRASR